MKKLYIIESLREGDEKTGKKIADIFSSLVKTYYFSCFSASSLETTFHEIENTVTAGDQVILSLEAHGDTNGMQLSDMNVVAWNEVAVFLRSINAKTEMGLTVLASTCFGQYLDYSITIKNRAPFYESYGPNKKMEDDCILRYNTAIIRDFIKDGNLSQTIQWENTEPNKEGSVYVACNCVDLYKSAIVKYYKESLSCQMVVNRILFNIKQFETIIKLHNKSIEELIGQYICTILDKKYNEMCFYKYMDYFLMTDKNSPYALEKATITFDECWTEEWRASYKDLTFLKNEKIKNVLEKGQLSGKIICQSPIKRADDSELESFFSAFNFMELSFEISKLAKKAYPADLELPDINGTAYNDDILCRALELAVKYASKDGGKIPNEQNLVDILQYAAGEAEKYQLQGMTIATPPQICSADAETVAMRVAYTQFYEHPYNLIARYWYLFNHLWHKDRSSSIFPLDDIKELIGISYKELIAYGMWLSEKVFTCGLNAEEKKEMALVLKCAYTDGGFENFLNYFSCNQSDWSFSGNPPTYDLKPLVKADQKCPELDEIVYFIPAKNKLMSRITSGLYFDLCDKYKGADKKNPFKQEFGEVFEKYVGEILKYSLSSYVVSPEIVYREGKNEVKSVDFFVKKDEKLILIEVKQSSLFAGSKVSGLELELLDDLKKTVLKAAKQINKSKKIIVEKSDSSFASYFNCKNIIGLIVVNDPLYNANDICRKIISSEGMDLDNVYMINVSDLEDFLALQMSDQSFWDALSEKKTDFEHFDFKEYLHQKYDYSKLEHHFLEKYYKEVVFW